MNKKNIIGNNEIYLLWGDVTLLYNDDFNNHVSGETENFNNGYSFDGEYSGNNLGDFNYDSQDSISNIVQYYKPGEKIKVKVAYASGREYKEKVVTVTLADKSTIENLQKSAPRVNQ